MVLEPICCHYCHRTDVVKHGKSVEGKQRYRCRNSQGSHASFSLNYTYRAYLPAAKQSVANLTVHGSGIRDTARVLQISPTTAIEPLKTTPLAGNGEPPTPGIGGNAAHRGQGDAGGSRTG